MFTIICIYCCNQILGVGAGQIIASSCVITYYSSLVALTVYYFFASFSTQLPWSQCLAEWGASCVDSKSIDNSTFLVEASETQTDLASSSEMYFLYVQMSSLPAFIFFQLLFSFILKFSFSFQKGGFESEVRHFRRNR